MWKIVRDNGVDTAYRLPMAGQSTDIEHGKGSETLAAAHYELDPLGRRSEAIDGNLSSDGQWTFGSVTLQPRKEIVRAMERIYTARMTTCSGGNLSIRDCAGDIWITPARVDKGRLRSCDIACVGADGTCDGSQRPSSEFPMHRAIYRARPDLGAVVHAHPAGLVAFALCHRVPDTRVHAHVRAVCGQVALAAYECPGSEVLAQGVASEFAAGADCVMLANHGVAVGGRDLREAVERFETLEVLAQLLVKAAGLGPVRPLDDAALAATQSSGSGPPSVSAVDPGEPAQRAQLCDFVERAERQRLLLGTMGTFAARLSGDEFLVTPGRRQRFECTPADLVRCGSGWSGAGRQPGRGTALAARLLQADRAIGAAIIGLAPNLGAFAMTATDLPAATTPESYMAMRTVPRIPFADLERDVVRIAERVSLQRWPVLLIENEGAVVVGRDLLEAFDRLEVLEATAAALLLSRPLGSPIPLTATALAQLPVPWN